MVSKKTVHTLLAGAVALTVAGGIGAAKAADVHEDPAAAAVSTTAEKEKCYGVVKAGHNDCASSSGTHSCAGHATTDSAADDWIALPAGVCNKLVGGSTTPKSDG